MEEAYPVTEYTIGVGLGAQRIVFTTLSDLEKAYKEIDSGKDLYISKDGLIVRLFHQMISAKIYNGEILLCANQEKK